MTLWYNWKSEVVKMSEKIPVTQSGLDELHRELRRMIEVERPEVIEELKEARAQGDLSENADYDAARDRQARVEAKIRELEKTIENAVLIDETKANKHRRVGLGATVTIYDYGIEEEETFTIVGSVEADPENGRLSNVSPLAKAMIDASEGDIVTVDVDEPYKVKILKVK